MQKRFEKIENLQRSITDEQRKYVSVSKHSSTRAVDLTYANVWDSGVEVPFFEAAQQMGVSSDEQVWC